jgi:hypothetical protein
LQQWSETGAANQDRSKSLDLREGIVPVNAVDLFATAFGAPEASDLQVGSYGKRFVAQVRTAGGLISSYSSCIRAAPGQVIFCDLRSILQRVEVLD